MFHVKRSRKPLKANRMKVKSLYPLLRGIMGRSGPVSDGFGLLAQAAQGLQQVVEVVHTIVFDLNAALLLAVGNVAGPA